MPKKVDNQNSESFFARGYCGWLIQQTLSNSPLWSLVIKISGEAVLRPPRLLRTGEQLPPASPLLRHCLPLP